MNKFTSLVLAIVCSLGLVMGCGDSVSGPSLEKDGEKVKKTVTTQDTTCTDSSVYVIMEEDTMWTDTLYTGCY